MKVRSARLKQLIKNSGKSYTEVATGMSMQYQSLNKRFKNPRSFTAEEIEMMAAIIKVPTIDVVRCILKIDS